MVPEAPKRWVGGPYTICWVLWIAGAGLLACSQNGLVPSFAGWVGFGVAIVGTVTSNCVHEWQKDKLQKLNSPSHAGDEFSMIAQVDGVQNALSTVSIVGLDGRDLLVRILGTVQVRSQDYGTRTLNITAGTSFLDGRARGISDLSNGDRIRVSFIPNSNLATRIELMAGA